MDNERLAVLFHPEKMAFGAGGVKFFAETGDEAEALKSGAQSEAFRWLRDAASVLSWRVSLPLWKWRINAEGR